MKPYKPAVFNLFIDIQYISERSYCTLLPIGVGMGGAGGAAAPPTFQQEGLSPPNVHMLSLLFNVEPPQLLNHSYAYAVPTRIIKNELLVLLQLMSCINNSNNN